MPAAIARMSEMSHHGAAPPSARSSSLPELHRSRPPEPLELPLELQFHELLDGEEPPNEPPPPENPPKERPPDPPKPPPPPRNPPLTLAFAMAAC